MNEQNLNPEGQNPLTPAEPPAPSGAPQYAPPSYPSGAAQTMPQADPTQKTNTMAIVALILAFVFAPAGIVLGHISLSQIKKTGEQGRGLALAGTILGYVFTFAGILFFIIFGALSAFLYSGAYYLS